MAKASEQQRSPMNILIVMVGLPYSGKSTWAREQDYPIVCPDEIRLASHGQRFAKEAEPLVWFITNVMVKALFGAGNGRVILDAINITEDVRSKWINDNWETWFMVVETSKEECLQRATAAGDEIIIPVIERMATQLEQLSPVANIWGNTENEPTALELSEMIRQRPAREYRRG